jgi:hypothetical protein
VGCFRVTECPGGEIAAGSTLGFAFAFRRPNKLDAGRATVESRAQCRTWDISWRAAQSLILRRHGIEPAPERTVEVWTARGLKRFWCSSLSIYLPERSRLPVCQQREWVVDEPYLQKRHRRGGWNPDRKRYLIHDRGSLFTAEFQNLLGTVGVRA